MQADKAQMQAEAAAWLPQAIQVLNMKFRDHTHWDNSAGMSAHLHQEWLQMQGLHHSNIHKPAQKEFLFSIHRLLLRMITQKHPAERNCEYPGKEREKGPTPVANDLYSTDEV